MASFLGGGNCLRGALNLPAISGVMMHVTHRAWDNKHAECLDFSLRPSPVLTGIASEVSMIESVHVTFLLCFASCAS